MLLNLTKKKKYYKSSKTKWRKTIRNIQLKQNNVVMRLKVFRQRLQQIWRWRRNRKSYLEWKVLRYLMPYSLNQRSRLRQSSSFRLERGSNKYINWRLQKSVNWKKSMKMSKAQNKYQGVSILPLYSFLCDFGIMNMRLNASKNRTNIFKHKILLKTLVNNKKASQVTSINDVLSFYNPKSQSLNKKMVLESSLLLNALVQKNFFSAATYKYNPNLQRNLDSYFYWTR